MIEMVVNKKSTDIEHVERQTHRFMIRSFLLRMKRKTKRKNSDVGFGGREKNCRKEKNKILSIESYLEWKPDLAI